QHLVLSDGSRAWFRALTASELEAVSTGDTLEAAGYRTVRRIVRDCASEIERRFPKVLRRVGGYNLDALLREPFNMAKLMVGSEGTLGIVLEAKISLVALPNAKAVL